MTQRLPSLPNLGYLRKQAKDVLRVVRHRSPRWSLADAQHAVAHGYGFPSWLKLKLHVESVRRQRSAGSPPRRAQQDAAPDNVTAVPRGTIHASQGHACHPIEGTWATRPLPASGDRAQAALG